MCNPAALKAAEELHARSKGYSTSVRRSEQCRECVSTDRDEELSDVQDSDEEEHNKRSGRRFGYNPDSDDAWAEYQAVKEDDLFAW